MFQLISVTGVGKAFLAAATIFPVVGTAEEKKGEPATPHVLKEIDSNKAFENSLKTTGVTGLVHGSIPGTDMYVFVYGNPIQGGQHYSLIPKDNAMRKELEKTLRHQLVTINGKFLPQKTPQQHILLESIKVKEKWEPEVKFKYVNQPYLSLEELKKHLKEKQEMDCVVHAVLHDGKVIIVNNQENVIPVHVNDPKWTKSLRSSDKIKLRYSVREHDQGPPHLSLRTENNVDPVEVLDSILKLSKKGEVKLEGSLVLFPKSPLLTHDVYGLRVKDSRGLVRTFSLHNLRDEEDVKKINSILKEIWDKKKEGFIRTTSFFYNPDIRIEVTGNVNHFAQNQRNPLFDMDSKNIRLLK